MGIALFVIGNLAAIVTAACLVDILRVRGDRWLRATAGLVAYGATVLVAVMAAGLVGALRSWVPVAITVALAAICAPLAGRMRRRRSLPPEQFTDDLDTGPLVRLFVALGVGLALATVARLFFGPTQFAFDDFVYHAAAVAEWIQQGRLSLGAFSYQAYHPQNAEQVCLWFAMPLGRDALVSLASAYWLLLLIVAATALTRQMGATGWLQAAPALGLLLSNRTMQQTACFAPTNLAEAATVVAAVALMVSALRRSGPMDLGVVALTGIAAGMAVGIRSSAIPVVVLIVVIMVASAARDHRRWQWLRVLSVLVLAILVMGSYWYVRNTVLTGNPVYPAAVGPFDGPLDAQTRGETTLLHKVGTSNLKATGLLYTVWRMLDWPRPLGFLALLGLGTGIATATRGAGGRGRGVVMAVVGATLVGAVVWSFLPFSGMNNIAGAPLKTGLRFWMVPFSLGLVLLGAARREWMRGLALVVSALLALAVYSNLGGYAPSGFGTVIITGLALGVVGALWWHSVRRRLWITRTRAKTLVALTVAVLIIVGAWSPMKQDLTDAEVFGEPEVGEGWRAVNALPADSRIAWFGPVTHAYYPLYGRNYQFDPVPVFDDGSAWAPLHERDTAPGRWWDVIHHQQQRRGDPGDLSVLVENLEALQIDYVFTSTYGSDKWPPNGQAEMLAESKRVRAIHRDGTNTIWRISELASR